MNAKEKKFVQTILKNPEMSSAEAARIAGYAPKTSSAAASRLLKNVNVREALIAGQDKVAKKHEITLERLVNELSSMAFATIPEVIEWNDSGVGFRQTDKLKAIEMIAKMTGLYSDKLDLTVKEDKNPAIDVDSEVLNDLLEAPVGNKG